MKATEKAFILVEKLLLLIKYSKNDEFYQKLGNSELNWVFDHIEEYQEKIEADFKEEIINNKEIKEEIFQSAKTEEEKEFLSIIFK